MEPFKDFMLALSFTLEVFRKVTGVDHTSLGPLNADKDRYLEL